jgi:hypothetical protein
MPRINEWLDRLPRSTVYLTGAEAPAFRAAGVFGFHIALVTLFGGALLRTLPLTVAIVIALTAVASFFGWALVRRALTHREVLVLFEHVWFAGVAVAGVLVLFDVPLLTWLDVLAVALCVFLAAGRVGCAIAGCCHGHPASLGIRYPDGHPVTRVAGLRLFPVPLIESAGLLVLAVTGLAALPLVAPGAVLVWVLAAYAVLRFGTEGLRGDHRPHALGIPIARLAASIQLLAALVIDAARHPEPGAPRIAAAALVGLVAAGMTGLFWYGRRPRPVTVDRVAQVRTLVAQTRNCTAPDGAQPIVHVLPDGITVATTATPEGVHLSVGGQRVGVAARQRLARAATGGEEPTIVGPQDVIHVFHRWDSQPASQREDRARFLPPWPTRAVPATTRVDGGSP